MGVYTLLESTETNIDLSGIIECNYEPGIEAACNIIAESEANFSTIMKAIGLEELKYYEENHVEMVYESGQISAFFSTAKQFFLNIWEKIKGLFRKFFAMIDKYVKSDKDFINKYKSHLLSVSTTDFKYKGYEFTPGELDLGGIDDKLESHIINVSKDLDGFLTKLKDKQDIIENMYGIAIGTSSADRAEFNKEVFSKLRKGEDSKSEIDNISVATLLALISETSTITKEAKKAYTDLEKGVKAIIKNLEKEEKELLKNSPVKGADGSIDTKATDMNSRLIRSAHGTLDLQRERMNILQYINGAKLTAIKDQNRQAKSICVALMNYKPKNESTSNKSGSSVNEGGFLGNIVFK